MDARKRRRSFRAFAGALLVPLVGVLALAPAAGASAHDFLVQSSPAANSVQTTPIAEVSLTFNDRVLDLTGDGSSALAQVIGPKGKHFETACPSILDRTVTVPVALGGEGKYTVTWQIVSADGHTVSDSIVFEYRPDAAATSATGRTGRPRCGTDAGTSTAVPQSAGGGGVRPDAVVIIGIGIGIVVLALLTSIILILSGRRSGRPVQRISDDV